MRILQIAPMRSDRSSGVSNYVLELVKCLVSQSGVEIGLLSTLPAKVFDEKYISSDCWFIRGNDVFHKNPWFVDSAWLEKIQKEFGRPDIVHFHGVYCPMQTALARQMVRRGWKYIVSPHGGVQPTTQRRKAWKKVLGNILFFDAFVRHALAVHVLNDAESMAVRRRYSGIKTIIVPNAVSAEMLSNATSSRAIEKGDRLRFGFIGRIDVDHKGVDLLLQALLLLEKNNPSLSWQLVLVGNFFAPRDKRIVMRLIKQFEDPQRVVLTGPLKEQAKWDALAGFNVFVHTSRYEGMPTSAIEAMAFAKPCLVTPGTNIQKVIMGCNGGWCCEANPQSIRDALINIYMNCKEIEQKGLNAQEYVRQHLTWDTIAAQYVQRVMELLDAK